MALGDGQLSRSGVLGLGLLLILIMLVASNWSTPIVLFGLGARTRVLPLGLVLGIAFILGNAISLGILALLDWAIEPWNNPDDQPDRNSPFTGNRLWEKARRNLEEPWDDEDEAMETPTPAGFNPNRGDRQSAKNRPNQSSPGFQTKDLDWDDPALDWQGEPLPDPKPPATPSPPPNPTPSPQVSDVGPDPNPIAPPNPQNNAPHRADAPLPAWAEDDEDEDDAWDDPDWHDHDQPENLGEETAKVPSEDPGSRQGSTPENPPPNAAPAPPQSDPQSEQRPTPPNPEPPRPLGRSYEADSPPPQGSRSGSSYSYRYRAATKRSSQPQDPSPTPPPGTVPPRRRRPPGRPAQPGSVLDANYRVLNPPPNPPKRSSSGPNKPPSSPPPRDWDLDNGDEW